MTSRKVTKCKSPNGGVGSTDQQMISQHVSDLQESSISSQGFTRPSGPATPKPLTWYSTNAGAVLRILQSFTHGLRGMFCAISSLIHSLIGMKGTYRIRQNEDGLFSAEFSGAWWLPWSRMRVRHGSYDGYIWEDKVFASIDEAKEYVDLDRRLRLEERNSKNNRLKPRTVAEVSDQEEWIDV